MQAMTGRSKARKLAIVVAVMVTMALSQGVVAADNAGVGLTECEQLGCAVVSEAGQLTRQLAVIDMGSDTAGGGPLRPHFTP